MKPWKNPSGNERRVLGGQSSRADEWRGSPRPTWSFCIRGRTGSSTTRCQNRGRGPWGLTVPAEFLGPIHVHANHSRRCARAGRVLGLQVHVHRSVRLLGARRRLAGGGGEDNLAVDEPGHARRRPLDAVGVPLGVVVGSTATIPIALYVRCQALRGG